MNRRSAPAFILAVTLSIAAAAMPASSRAAPDFDLPAVQVRIALDRVLAEHVFLNIQAMRTGIEGGAEFDVAAAVLEENTVELVDLVETAYGAEAGPPFGELWRNHIAYLVDYTRAAANGDVDARDLAAEQLRVYVDDFSELLAAANPGLPSDVVKGLINEHVQQLEQIGSLAQADYSEAYPAIGETYDHMFMVGDGLALGIADRFADRFPGRDTAFSPALDLRLTLDRLLGEHTYLAAIAMRARLDDATDLDAAAVALEANSAELADEIGTIYGDDAGAAFGELWRSHTAHYLDYVAAVADDDSGAADAALEGLGTYRSDFSAFLADANPFLEAPALEALLETHTEQLVEQVAAYQAEEYDAAYSTLREAYAHTAELAAGLAGAIVDQFPQVFPDTATEETSSRGVLGVLGLLLLGMGGLAAARRTMSRCRSTIPSTPRR